MAALPLALCDSSPQVGIRYLAVNAPRPGRTLTTFVCFTPASPGLTITIANLRYTRRASRTPSGDVFFQEIGFHLHIFSSFFFMGSPRLLVTVVLFTALHWGRA